MKLSVWLVTVAACGWMTQALVVNPNEVRWCVTSDKEKKKCMDLAKALGDLKSQFSLLCVQRDSPNECYETIKSLRADAVTLDGGDIYKAGEAPYNLRPLAGEDYGPAQGACYYAVAVVKAGRVSDLRNLEGKKSCHTGVGKSAGWNLPIGKLLEKGILTWDGPSSGSVEKAVSNFFSSSCAPGSKELPFLDKASKAKLCGLCIGKGDNKCVKNAAEPYYDYGGAFRCLKEDAGDVAFVKHVTVNEDTTEAERAGYELLCGNGGRAPVSDYRRCHIAFVAAHAVVARSSDDIDQRKRSAILGLLNEAENYFGVNGTQKSKFELFSSSSYGGKNLLFKDSTQSLFRLPALFNHRSYLGSEYTSALASLSSARRKGKNPLRWCCISDGEKNKCDAWDLHKRELRCLGTHSMEKCIWMIKNGEADVMSLDGGQVYLAGKCGLIPVMAEYYDDDKVCSGQATGVATGKYYAVAIVKKTNRDMSLKDLSGKSVCHTGINRTAGWNIPIGQLVADGKIDSCNIEKGAARLFGPSCAPGSQEASLCERCIGEEAAAVGSSGRHKCEFSSHERYFGYSGAFRCLVETGDVAFAKHTTVSENTDGASKEAWTKNLRSSDYELLCADGRRAPVSAYKTCHLAQAPSHAVVTRAALKTTVQEFLKDSQLKYGRSGTDREKFSLFSSERYQGKDLLFKDSTKCLVKVEADSYRDFLGAGYAKTMDGLNACAQSDLQEACEFDVCQLPRKYHSLQN
ncbi:serotransferrin-1-like [Lampetra fluviatilis]